MIDNDNFSFYLFINLWNMCLRVVHCNQPFLTVLPDHTLLILEGASGSDVERFLLIKSH